VSDLPLTYRNLRILPSYLIMCALSRAYFLNLRRELKYILLRKRVPRNPSQFTFSHSYKKAKQFKFDDAGKLNSKLRFCIYIITVYLLYIFRSNNLTISQDPPLATTTASIIFQPFTPQCSSSTSTQFSSRSCSSKQVLQSTNLARSPPIASPTYRAALRRVLMLTRVSTKMYRATFVEKCVVANIIQYVTNTGGCLI
jgi:hypothetical protein